MENNDKNSNQKKYPKLKKYLADRNITQKKLIAETRISKVTIIKLVNEGIASEVVIYAVSKALKISFDYLKKLLVLED